MTSNIENGSLYGDKDDGYEPGTGPFNALTKEHKELIAKVRKHLNEEACEHFIHDEWLAELLKIGRYNVKA